MYRRIWCKDRTRIVTVVDIKIRKSIRFLFFACSKGRRSNLRRKKEEERSPSRELIIILIWSYFWLNKIENNRMSQHTQSNDLSKSYQVPQRAKHKFESKTKYLIVIDALIICITKEVVL